jgi:outer membrane protein assembly factor BamD
MAQYKLAECYYELSPRAPLDQKYTMKAIREYQYFIEENPGHEMKDDAEKKIMELRNKLAKKEYGNAETYRKMREFESAIIYYDQVLDHYYDTEWADEALFGKIKSLLELEEYGRAQVELDKFTQQFPNSKLLDNVRGISEDIRDLLVKENG